MEVALRGARRLGLAGKLRAVAVPKGSHRVEFHFRSRAIRQGLLISCGSLVVSLILLAAGLLRRPAAGAATGGA